ncbi:MAG: multidrug transporter substrate-binding protein [Rhodospirillales bacterium]|jgi:putative ABC transport system permease protein|nr:multidrug transporter substrate-binding protein [Rhodospirillales bacterium]
MNFTDAIGSALTAVRANVLRSVLTALGIIIGVAAVIVMVAVGSGAQERIDGYIKGLGSNLLLVWPGSSNIGGVKGGRGTRPSLTEDDASAIQNEISGVEVTAPQVQGNAQAIFGNRNWGSKVVGTTPEYEIAHNWVIADGRWFTAAEVRSTAKVVLLGNTVAEQLFDGGSPIGQTVRIKTVPFEVIGVLAPKGESLSGQDQDDIMLMPVTTARNRIVGGRQIKARQVQHMFVKIRTPEEIDDAMTDITDLLRQRHKVREGRPDDFTIRNMSQILEARSSSARVMTLLLAAVASISLIVGGIGIMNIMLVSVTERTREIGLRMAIGARRRDILRQFLIEAVTLSLIGGCIGVVLGVGTSIAIAQLGDWPTSISIGSIVLAFGFSAAIGVFFGFYPARKAARLDPIEALRYE